MAAVIMLVVILVVGALGYVGLNASKGGTQEKTSCTPANSPACAAYSNLHDVALNTPFKAVQQGNIVPFTAALPAGESSTSYTFNFGDGSTVVTQPGASTTHVYASTGTYIASVQATVNGVQHDSYRALDIITVSASYASGSAGDTPGVAGSIESNVTASGATPVTSGATAILQPGGSVTVSGTYTSAPTNPSFTYQPPTIVASTGGSVGTLATSNTSASGPVTFTSSGIFTVTFVGSSVSGSATAFQNYTWTVFVAPSGLNAGAVGGKSSSSPHPGTLSVYEYFPGGSSSEDPAIDYETVGYEPIINVYQTLIAYNGSQTGPTYSSYVPQIATCVPGSPECSALYGTSLIVGDHYTFVISGDSQYYDPSNGAHWGVYPTDVMFSVARTLGFAVQPCVGCNNGWILAQSLLSAGSPTWDGGIHGGLNNTPNNIYASMSINDSTYCPTAQLKPTDHGCITFTANGNGHSWPYFLELIADPLGGSIVPCGWFSAPAQAAGIPQWTAGAVTGSGDQPCGAPGTTGWGVSPSSISPTAWDGWETAGSVPPFVGNVQWNMVGSGPYYMKSLHPGTSYTLQANPNWGPNSLCTWTGCQPAAGKYASTVAVTWETSQVPGEQAYQAGTADFAGIPVTDTALMLQLIQQGKIGALSFPSISIFFFPFDFSFDSVATARFTSNPVTIPADFFSHVGMRQFFAHAYPYQTIQTTINTKDGIQYLFNYGGAIPQFMANYYPTNVSWPTGDPSSATAAPSSSIGPTTAGYWFAQMQDPSSPYYDSEIASCTVANPCQFPFFAQTGSPDLDQRVALWASYIDSLSGGRIIMTPVDINFIELVINSLYSPAYQDPMPLYTLGWAPDYPDPTDYMVPLYQADGSYTYGDAVWEQTNTAEFNQSGCHSWSDYTWWSSNPVSDGCQGAAYSAMQVAMKIAAVTPAGPARVLLYAEIEQIANQLALYVYWGQQNTVATYASWINPSGINTNVTIGGGNDMTWFTITGNGVAG